MLCKSRLSGLSSELFVWPIIFLVFNWNNITNKMQNIVYFLVSYGRQTHISPKRFAWLDNFNTKRDWSIGASLQDQLTHSHNSVQPIVRTFRSVGFPVLLDVPNVWFIGKKAQFLSHCYPVSQSLWIHLKWCVIGMHSILM